MACGKVLLLQALLVGAALGQLQTGFTPFQNGFQPSPAFQPFQPLPLPALRQQQAVPGVPGGFQPPRPVQRFQPDPAQLRPAATTGPRTEVFGSGVESFKLVHHDQPAEVPAARSLPVIPAFQQPTAAAPAPVFQQPLPAAPAPAPAPALPRPIEQHDAQTFIRRPAEGAGQVIPFTKVNPGRAATNVRSQQQVLQDQDTQRFEQENLRIQQAQQAQLDSLRLQQAQQAQQVQQENSRVQQGQESVRDNLRFQKPAQQVQQVHQVQQVQQVQQVPQEAPQQDAFREVFEAPAASPPPRPAARKVHRGRARHQEDPELLQEVNGVRQQSRRLPEAAPAPALRTPIRVAEADEPALLEEQQAREQAENAHYTFASAIDDKLTDNSQVRQETRDGLNLAGLYSYSDGFFRRTVHYEADENGYRVTKEEVEPLGDGPRPDPAGTADVRAQISGTDFGYRITADDIREKTKEAVKQVVAPATEQRQRFAARAGERV